MASVYPLAAAFRDRFKTQGFYKTADGRYLNPQDVELVMSEVEK